MTVTPKDAEVVMLRAYAISKLCPVGFGKLWMKSLYISARSGTAAYIQSVL